TGQLNEYTERRELPADVLCMSLSEIPEGELRSRFLTVGLADKTVRIISLDPQDCLAPLSMQALPSEPESIIVLEMFGGEGPSASTVHLNIGLQVRSKCGSHFHNFSTFSGAGMHVAVEKVHKPGGPVVYYTFRGLLVLSDTSVLCGRIFYLKVNGARSEFSQYFMFNITSYRSEILGV
ncbi:Splicing factor 3B subunit 3, partial [Toxocara canis]